VEASLILLDQNYMIHSSHGAQKSYLVKACLMTDQRTLAFDQALLVHWSIVYGLGRQDMNPLSLLVRLVFLEFVVLAMLFSVPASQNTVAV
jgi:hypothetical protein